MSNGPYIDPESRQREIEGLSERLKVPQEEAARLLDESLARMDAEPEPVEVPEIEPPKPIKRPETEPPKIEVPEIEAPKPLNVTSGYGEMSERRNFPHRGIDIALPEGTPIKSLSSGTVTRIVKNEDGDAGGLRIFVRDNDGIETRYMHASGFPEGLEVGSQVNKDQVIMMSGNTGRSTGPHLHLETGKIGDDGQFIRSNPAEVYSDLFKGADPKEVPREVPEHLKPDFKLEIPTLLAGLEFARRRVIAGRGEESSIPQEIKRHAQQIGLDVKQLQEAASTQGISLGYMVDEVGRKGRSSDDVIGEARERGVAAFLDPEQRAARQKRGALADQDAVKKYQETGDHTFLLDEFGQGIYEHDEAMPFFGGQAIEFGEVAKPDEDMYKVASVISEAVMKDKQASSLVNALSDKYTGARDYAKKRASQYLKQRNLTPKDEEYLEMSRKFYDRAIREIVALKTVGMWTGPIIVPEEELLESQSNRDLSDRFFDALKPTVEIVGIRSFGQQSELVLREENPLLYFFNLIDMAQSAATGALTTEGDALEGAIEGMELRRNFFEAAIDSEFAEKNAATKTLAFVGGGLATILTPDALVGAGGVAKLTNKVVQLVTTQAAAKKAGQLLSDISLARQAEDYDKASLLEAELRREFKQKGGVADLLDVLDGEAAQFIAKNNPEMLDTSFIQKLAVIDRSLPEDSFLSARALALHPSVRKPRLSAGRGEGKVQAVGYGGMDTDIDEAVGLYEYGNIIDELQAIKKQLQQSATKGKLPQLQKTSASNIAKLEKLVDAANDPEGAQFIARLKESLADAIDDPKAWDNRFHGDGNLESELAKITGLRGPTQEEIAAATGKELTKLNKAKETAKNKRREIHDEIGKITTQAKNVEDPLALIDRAIDTVKANNESRGVAAKLLSETVLGSRKLKPITRDPTKDLAANAVELSSEANVLASKLETAYEITEDQAQALAGLMDARSRAWSTATGKPARDYFNEGISGIVKGEDIKKPLFEMNEMDDGLVELTTKEIKDANGFGLIFRVQDDALTVSSVNIPQAQRGKGIGTALYGRALQHAKSLGKGFASDVSPSPEAIRVYERLIKRGVPLRRRQVDLPDGTTSRQYVISTDDLAKVDLTGVELITLRPAVDIASDGRAILNAFTEPTFRGAVRGMAHVFRRDLEDYDLRVIEEWCGVKNGRWTEQAEAKWASGFENYLAEGVAPNNQVQTVFDKFKVWMSEAYRNVVGKPVVQRMPDNVRDIMNKLLTESPPNEPPFKRTLAAMSIGDPSKITKTNIDPLMELAKAARKQGMRNSEPNLMLSSLEANGQVTFRKPIEINGISKNVWTKEDLAELQLSLETKARITKQMEDAPEIQLRGAPSAEAAESIDEKIIAEVGGEGVLRGVAKFAVYAVLGGDHVGVALRRMRPEHRQSVLAATRSTEQAIGDAVTLVSQTGTKGGMTRLHEFLGGELTKFKSGRDALSSGKDFMGMSLTTIRQSFLDLDNVAFRGRKLGDFLREMVQAMDGPAGPKKGYEAFAGKSKNNKEAVQEIFARLGAKKQNQLMSDLFNAFGAAGAKRPQEAMFLKVMMEAANVHPGRLAGLKGAERAEEVFSAIENIYGGSKGREAALRASVLFAGHGEAAHARSVWAGLGLAVDDKMMDAWQSWLMGEKIDPELIPQMHAMVRNYGLRPEFIDDTVLEAGFHIPKVARERLTNALAKAGILDDPNKITDLTDTGIFFKSVYTYMKTRMTRGGVLVRQRYFLMNTVDHFSQMAMVAGFRPALVSTVRLSFQNLMVFPGFAHTLGLVDKLGGVQAGEKLRKVLQAGGDRTANLVGRFLNVSKYRVEVNPILEGVAKDGSKVFSLMDSKTGQTRFYNYADIRRIAVEEGIFASFDTRALERAINTGVRVEYKKFLDKAPAPISNAVDNIKGGFGFFTDNVAKTAECWSERERIGAMVTLMEAGMEPRQAARLAINGLFDYAGTMSKLDRNWVVNLMFPFWAFQKNANRLILRQMFTPQGAYKMGVLRRAYTVSADAITELLYERVADPYGIDADRMPVELKEKYYFLRGIIENGYGPLDQLKNAPMGDSILKGIEEQYGPIEMIDAETRKFLEQGYGGYSKTPADVRDAVRLYLAGVTSGMPDELGSKRATPDQRVELNFRLADRMGQLRPRTAEGETFSDYYNARPGKSARRNFHRDRVGIPIKPAMTEDVRKFLRMAEDDPVIGFDDVYLEALYPDSTIYAGFRHAAAVIAVPIIMGRGLIKDLAGSPEDEAISDMMYRTALDMAGDPLDSPIPSLMLSATTEVDSRPRRLNVEFAKTLRNLKDMGLPLPSITIVKATEDRFAPKGEGVIKRERAYMMGGTGSMIFSLTPLGELNDIMSRLEQAPIQEKMGIQGELLKWAEVVMGLQVVETSRQVSARADAPKFKMITTAPPTPK